MTSGRARDARRETIKDKARALEKRLCDTYGLMPWHVQHTVKDAERVTFTVTLDDQQLERLIIDLLIGSSSR